MQPLRIGVVCIPVILHCLLIAMWCTSSTLSIKAVTVTTEDLACWTPEKAAWSLTCRVTIPNDTYVHEVQVKALDRFESHSIIAKCSRGTYRFSSFAQFMGKSGSPCIMPIEHSKEQTFSVPFSFTNVSANSDGRMSFLVRNVTCSVLVYFLDDYEEYPEQATQDLVQCTQPKMELPSAYYFTAGNEAVVTCFAWNAIPEARILLTITPATDQSLLLNSVTGLNAAEIAINASLMYHRAIINCTVLNHAHYLSSKTSEILLYHIIQKASIIDSLPIEATSGDALNCSESLISYPDAEYKWYMDDVLIGNNSVYILPCFDGETLECVATNSAANASVHVAYTSTCNALSIIIVTVIVPFMLAVSLAIILVRVHRQAVRRRLGGENVKIEKPQHECARRLHKKQTFQAKTLGTGRLQKHSFDHVSSLLEVEMIPDLNHRATLDIATVWSEEERKSSRAHAML